MRLLLPPPQTRKRMQKGLVAALGYSMVRNEPFFGSLSARKAGLALLQARGNQALPWCSGSQPGELIFREL